MFFSNVHTYFITDQQKVLKVVHTPHDQALHGMYIDSTSTINSHRQ